MADSNVKDCAYCFDKNKFQNENARNVVLELPHSALCFSFRIVSLAKKLPGVLRINKHPSSTLCCSSTTSLPALGTSLFKRTGARKRRVQGPRPTQTFFFVFVHRTLRWSGSECFRNILYINYAAFSNDLSSNVVLCYDFGPRPGDDIWTFYFVSSTFISRPIILLASESGHTRRCRVE